MKFELLVIGFLSPKEWWFDFFQINSFSVFKMGNGFYKFDGGSKHYRTFIFKFCNLGWEMRLNKI